MSIICLKCLHKYILIQCVHVEHFSGGNIACIKTPSSWGKVWLCKCHAHVYKCDKKTAFAFSALIFTEKCVQRTTCTCTLCKVMCIKSENILDSRIYIYMYMTFLMHVQVGIFTCTCIIHSRLRHCDTIMYRYLVHVITNK